MLLRAEELRTRLGSFLGLFLVPISLAGACMTPPPPASLVVWEMSNASSVEQPIISSLSNVRLLSEIRSTQAVLALSELTEEPCFWSYLLAIDDALTAYEHPGNPKPDAATFSSALALARTALLDQLSSLPRWLAVVDVTQPDGARYPAVPARFQAPAQIDAIPTPPLSAEEVDTWMTLGLIPSV